MGFGFLNLNYLFSNFPILLSFLVLIGFVSFGRLFVSELPYNLIITGLIFVFSFFVLSKIMKSRSEFLVDVHPFIRSAIALSLSGMASLSAINFSFFSFEFVLFDIFSFIPFTFLPFVLNGFFIFTSVVFLFFIVFSLKNVFGAIASFILLVLFFNFLRFTTFFGSYSQYFIIFVGIVLIVFLPLLFLRVGKSFSKKESLKDKIISSFNKKDMKE